MGLPNSAESPLPVRTVARSISEWVARLGRVWVEGQVTQVSRRPGTVYLTLRDPVADMSLSVTCSRQVCEAVVPPLREGDRVVVHAQPDFYTGRGTLSLAALEIRPVGVGELLARLERLKVLLGAEGLFAADRKQRLPFLPAASGSSPAAPAPRSATSSRTPAGAGPPSSSRYARSPSRATSPPGR